MVNLPSEIWASSLAQDWNLQVPRPSSKYSVSSSTGSWTSDLYAASEPSGVICSMASGRVSPAVPDTKL